MKKNQSNLIVILFFITLFTITLLKSLLTPLTFYDETWNFQSIFKMYQGGILYTDNNVIHTPIFFILTNLIFHLCGANLVVFRLFNAFIFLTKYSLLFCILKKLGSNNLLSILYLSFWFVIDTNMINAGANYNQLVLIMCLIGILWYITHFYKKFYHFGQGIILFFIFFTKQNIGVYYAFALILFDILQNGFHKKFWISQLAKLASFLPCLLISITIMYFRGNLFNFINLCFGSLFEFGSSNMIFNIDTLPYIIFMIFVAIFSIYLLKNPNITINIKRNIKFLLCLAIGLSFTIFPIINPYHTIMALLFYCLLFIYTLDNLILREIFHTKWQKYVILSICFLLLFCMFIRLVFIYFTETSNLMHFNKTHVFYNAPIAQEDLHKINEMTNYIVTQKKHGINVIVLSYEAAVYMVPLQINNHEFDLFLNGNLGYHGIQNTINKISKMQNTEFLIFTNEEDCFYQEPKQVRDYIIQHLEKKGEFLNYSIYINK